MKSRRMNCTGHVACMVEKKNTYKTSVEKHEGKRPLGRAKGRWEDNIRMGLREIGWEFGDWMQLAQDWD
jgi:hypothetical protein